MLTDKEKKLLARHRDDLAMPKWKFILLYGFSFGFLMLIVSSIWDMLFEHLSVSELFGGRFWTYLRVAPIGGFLFGLTMRWVIARQYNKLKGKEEAHKEEIIVP